MRNKVVLSVASTKDYIDYICEQLPRNYMIRFRKMFGEYMIYLNEKPILLVCDNTVYIKMVPDIADLMKNEDRGYPYKGSKEHYILPIEDGDLCNQVLSILEAITPIPQKKKRE